METTRERKSKLLVVDDNSANIRIIGSILRSKEYQVGFATGGQQALDILTNVDEDYDLVLLDVNMPEINGFEVCKKIREIERLKELPVIFLTANADNEDIVEGFAVGGQDYVTKPFNSGELVARINTHLELKDKREQLKQINTILEDKVKERTLELEEANKKLEAANHELEKLDEAKVGFLHLISHEINTPLNGIIGFASVLREQLVSTKYFGYIDYLAESAKRLNDFAQSSLIITEMRTSPESYPIEKLNVCALVDNVFEKQEIFIKKKEVGVVFTNDAVTTEITGNKYLIITSITHLFRNAVQNSPKGESVTVRCYNENNYLFVSFEDNGPGFSEVALRNLFKPFSTIGEHVNENKGLGLMLVKMIVDFHHAQIKISNSINSGARVVLIFNQPEI